MFDTALAHANRSRAFYEFSVWMGDSFRYLIDHFPQGYGLDTFEGLPEEWHGLPRGSYTIFGEVPNILGAEFVVGEFRDTLSEFFADERPMAGLINFDANLYSSTITALNYARPVIDSSTVLVFDEFIVNRNWEHEEFRALEEFCATNGLRYEVLAVSLFTKQMACRLRWDAAVSAPCAGAALRCHPPRAPASMARAFSLPRRYRRDEATVSCPSTRRGQILPRDPAVRVSAILTACPVLPHQACAGACRPFQP